MEPDKESTGMNYGLMALMGLVGILAIGTFGARATGPFTDLPIDMGAALGISAENAGFLLSCAILMSLALTLAMVGGKKLSIFATIIPLIATMGFLVAVAWLPFWVIIVIALLIAYMFGTSMRDTLAGK